MTAPVSTWVHEGCGGVFRPHTDGITVDAGGFERSITWTEYVCDRCGMTDAEAYGASRERGQDHGDRG